VTRALKRIGDHAWRVFFTGSSFVFFFTGASLLSHLVLPLVVLFTRDRVLRARRCRAVVRRAWVLFHDYMRWTRLLRYDARQTRLPLPAGPFVLIANHPTLVDVTALMAALPDAVVVVKRAMIRSPMVGPVLRRCRHIDAGDGGSFAGVSVFEQAVQHLAEGTPVLLFPEGTRSPERGLGEFRRGAFQIAAHAGVPLVAALIRCEPPTLMRGQPWYEIPERTAVLSIDPLTVVEPHGGAAQLARAVRDTYLRALGLGPATAAEPTSAAPPAREPRPLAAVSGG
jgi:1-acyl-sn-glycerol-3-phosphate acyltransferase